MASSVFLDAASGITITGTSVLFPSGFSATITTPNIGVTSTDALVLTNPTAAAVGAQQMPGRIRFDGFGWKTDATAGSQAVSFINEVLPVQGTSAPTAQLLWKYSVAGGAYSTRLTLSSAGVLTTAADVISGGWVYAAAGSALAWDSRGSILAPADGQANFRNNADSAGVGFDYATDAVLKVRTRAQSAYATIDVLGIQIAGGTSITAPIAGVAAGYKVARGSTALDGSNPTTVATGLTSVVSFVATLIRNTAITTGTAFVTHDAASGANVDLYGWVVAGTASTGTELVDWVAVGT